MPNKNYQRGVRAERLLMKELADQGYLVCRTAGSHGVFDVIASNASDRPRFIQVKVTESKSTKDSLLKSWQFAEHPHMSMELWVRFEGKWYCKESA